LNYSVSTTPLLAAGGAGDRTSNASREDAIDTPPWSVPDTYGRVLGSLSRFVKESGISSPQQSCPSNQVLWQRALCAASRKSPVVDTLPQIPVRSLTTQPLRTLPEQNRTLTQHYAYLSLSPGPGIVCLTGRFRISVVYRISVHVTGNPWPART